MFQTHSKRTGTNCVISPCGAPRDGYKSQHFLNLLSWVCQSLLLVTCDGEFFVFIDTTYLARLAAGEPALSYTDPGRAWHPVGDESLLHCFLLSVFSTVQFVHYA